MRNLDERMAEIALRSEKRIQARKTRRRQLLAACIPAVLCVGLCAGLFAGYPAMNTPPNEGESYMPPPAVIPSQSSESTFPEAVVSGSGVSLRVTDREDVEKIAGLIQSAMASPDSAISSPKACLPGSPYAISLTLSDGTVLEYTLIDNELIDRRTQEVYRLPDGTLWALQDALGLPG